jgi:hypothetical protein
MQVCGTGVFRFRPRNFGFSRSVWVRALDVHEQEQALVGLGRLALRRGLVADLRAGGNWMSKFVTRFGCLFFAVFVSSVDDVRRRNGGTTVGAGQCGRRVDATLHRLCKFFLAS